MALIPVYAPGASMAAIVALAPFLPDGVLTSVTAALIVGLIWFIPLMGLAIGFSSRRYWGVILFFWMGVTSFLILSTAVVEVAFILLSTRRAPPEAIYMTWFAACLLAPMAPFSPLLIRALQLKYWQPWTRPEQWEIGDELNAAWASPTLAARRAAGKLETSKKPRRGKS